MRALQRRAEARQLTAQVELARQLEEAVETRRTLLNVIESQRQAEAELRASEKRYRSIFDLAPDPLFLVSTDPTDGGRILDANELDGHRPWLHAGRIIADEDRRVGRAG